MIPNAKSIAALGFGACALGHHWTGHWGTATLWYATSRNRHPQHKFVPHASFAEISHCRKRKPPPKKNTSHRSCEGTRSVYRRAGGQDHSAVAGRGSSDAKCQQRCSSGKHDGLGAPAPADLLSGADPRPFKRRRGTRKKAPCAQRKSGDRTRTRSRPPARRRALLQEQHSYQGVLAVNFRNKTPPHPRGHTLGPSCKLARHRRPRTNTQKLVSATAGTFARRGRNCVYLWTSPCHVLLSCADMMVLRSPKPRVTGRACGCRQVPSANWCVDCGQKDSVCIWKSSTSLADRGTPVFKGRGRHRRSGCHRSRRDPRPPNPVLKGSCVSIPVSTARGQGLGSGPESASAGTSCRNSDST